MLDQQKWMETFTNSFTTMFQEEMNQNILLFHQLQMVQIQILSKLWIKNLKKQKILDQQKLTETSINSFIIMFQEETSQSTHQFHQLQMVQIQNLSKHWLKNLKKQKILDQQKLTETFTNSSITMFQEEMNLNTQLFHQLQMVQTQNLLKL